MKIRNLSINLLIFVLIIGSAMNFNLYGWPDSPYLCNRNLYGTLIYAAAWVGILILAAMNGNVKILPFYRLGVIISNDTVGRVIIIVFSLCMTIANALLFRLKRTREHRLPETQ